jgi:hypothetical protein
MRKLIAAMKLSADGRSEGPDGGTDWVDAWSEDYGLMERIDACLLGGASGSMNLPGASRWRGVSASEAGLAPSSRSRQSSVSWHAVGAVCALTGAVHMLRAGRRFNLIAKSRGVGPRQRAT